MGVTEGMEPDFSSGCIARGQEAIVRSCSKEKFDLFIRKTEFDFF